MKLRTRNLILVGMLSTIFSSTAYANPTGGNVVAGSASIIPSDGSTLQINQASQAAAINWQSFSIGGNERVNFNQPNAQSIVLNRVLGSDPSKILGTMAATGQVMLVNPAGIFFGKNSKVDVSSLVATTAQIKNEDFMAGRYQFQQAPNSRAVILGEGNINIARYGFVAFVAPTTQNTGVVRINFQRVALPEGKVFVADFYGDSMLNLKVADDAGVWNAMSGVRVISQNNSMRMSVGGGGWDAWWPVPTSLARAKAIVDHVVNLEGVHQATRVVMNKGIIELR